ncbi:hypothetical protein [Acetobacter ghanensis]|nr:hypothetical protein [Acetobacter ghanensis]NHO39433.1 hypothetical protein [Acetobacter ghanensis]GBQ46536.1 hypothetical protein AA18895_0794 [Acetobacter ghanensis DSM 18895]
MTDPRIEAAARAICSEIFCMDWNNADVSRKDECIAASRVALAAADAAAWRSIESAPRDTNILTHYEDGRVMADRFPYRGMLEWQEQFDKPPTHWQPFPSPPNTEASPAPETITIPEVRNDRPIPVKGGVDG